MRSLVFIFLFCFTSIFFAQEFSSELINKNLNCSTINESVEDKELYKGKVYSVKIYESADASKKVKTDKVFESQFMVLKSFTNYRKDGRRISRLKYNTNSSYSSKYYYDKISGNLLLEENENSADYGKSHYYTWLFYNPDQILADVVSLQNIEEKFIYSRFSIYKAEDSLNQKKISVTNISYDSIKNPENIYIFNGQNLSKYSPLYRYKIEKTKLINGVYKPYEIDGYVVEDRKVYYKYDDNGYLLSEIWYNEKGLENKDLFTYNLDYSERTHSKIQWLGTKEFSKTLCKYDQYGNLLFEQENYYDGSIGSIKEYEYQYDKENNWTVKKSFLSEASNGIISKKKLITTELREINYYTSNSVEENFPLPKMPGIVNDIRKNIPAIAKVNAINLKRKKAAIDAGAYDDSIILDEANETKDFTPEYWLLKDTAYGNLDEDDADEAVAVFEMPSIDQGDTEQVLAIFKKVNNNWKIIHQTSAPILSSQSGGMMGNPFDGVSISNKSIVINHFGGSRDKWAYTHRFRFQNGDWYLIGASSNFGASCDYLVKFDYNLSTGDATYAKTKEDCNNGNITTVKKAKYNRKIKLPKMDDLIPGDNTFKFPLLKEEIYY